MNTINSIYSASTNTTLRKPREHVELERTTCQRQLLKYSLDIICKSIYISMDFQVSERLCQGPEFSRNYTIGYIIIT